MIDQLISFFVGIVTSQFFTKEIFQLIDIDEFIFLSLTQSYNIC
jgi:hypothetical protein